MSWSPQQDDALVKVRRWLDDPGSQQVYRLFGVAGTGKTTLARHLTEGVDGDVMFMAYTGKAAHVLQQKGCPASTIHSAIYHNRDNLSQPAFTLNHDSPVKDAALVCVDEGSMVDSLIGEDLLSFGTPVLVLGDPAQLPPVKGTGFFTQAEPDVTLTEIHRQAAENPIIAMATRVRNQKSLEVGDYGDSKVIEACHVDPDEVRNADQLLVGRNATRHAYNRRMRTLMGRDDPMPVVDDRLVCLRNDHDVGLLNGSIWYVNDVGPYDEDRITLSVTSEDNRDGHPVDLEAHTHYFLGEEEKLGWWERKEAQEFDYGYALTVHKSQGSQWDDVVLFDESWCFRKNRWQWLYTGLTRAAERVTVVRM